MIFLLKRFMKKMFILFLSFIASISALWLIDIPFLAATGKTILTMAIAITFEILLMDMSSIKRKTRAALRKEI
jgi:hypothetical protein